MNRVNERFTWPDFPRWRTDKPCRSTGAGLPCSHPMEDSFSHRANTGLILTAGSLMTVLFAADPGLVLGTPRMLFEGAYMSVRGPRLYDLAPDADRFLMQRRGDARAINDAPLPQVLVLNWFEELKRLVPVN